MNEIIALKNKYHIKRVIITHLEEDWGKSYDDYINLQKQFDGIEFALDGLENKLLEGYCDETRIRNCKVRSCLLLMFRK